MCKGDVMEGASEELEILRRWKHAVDNALWAIAIGSADGHIEMANPAFAKLYGYSVEELQGMPISALYPPEERKWLPERLEQALHQGHLILDTTHLRKDGSTFPAMIDLGPVFAADGSLAYRTVYVQDLSERASIDQAVRERESQMRLLTDTAPVMLSYVDASRHYRFVNQAYELLFGRPRSEIIGKRVIEVLGEKAYAKIKQHIDAALAGESVTYEFVLACPDADRNLTVSYAPDIGESGEVRGFVVAVTDITHAKQLEHRLRRSQRLEAIGRLAGGIAHDFNNILSVVLMYAGSLHDAYHDRDPIGQDILKIRDAAERATRLANQLLAFSSRQPQKLIVLNLNNTFSEIHEMLRRMIGADIELVTKLETQLASVKADRSQIEQVLMNLVLNARDAMPEGGRLTLETANVELARPFCPGESVSVPAGRYVRLRVSDTGSGIDEEIQAYIFEPFFTTKTESCGTGLGLSTVYGIVKQSGGHTISYNNPDGGAVFEIYLPFVEGQASPLPQRRSDKPAGGQETILLAEDEDLVRSATSRILQRSGYKVLEAVHGDDALRIAKVYTEQIDLLLTDVMMPTIGGRELSNRLALLHPQMRTLYMSGYTEDAVSPAASADEETMFIQKPLSSKSLLGKVREVLDL